MRVLLRNNCQGGDGNIYLCWCQKRSLVCSAVVVCKASLTLQTSSAQNCKITRRMLCIRFYFGLSKPLKSLYYFFSIVLPDVISQQNQTCGISFCINQRKFNSVFDVIE